MQTHAAKRIEIIIERPMARRLTDALEEAGAPGFTILPVRGGYGTSGRWSREGQVGSAGGMLAVVMVVTPEKVDGLLETAFKVVESHIGIVSVTDAQVIRPERF